MNPLCEFCQHWWEVPEGEGRGYCDYGKNHIHYWETCGKWEDKEKKTLEDYAI